MEKKQLNFSAPLMSARRYSSPLRHSGELKKTDFHFPTEKRNAIPSHSQKSDMNMGEVVKPGSVPFMWEQIPGKAKGGNESNLTSPEEFPSTPRLPPGRKSGELNGYRTPNKLSGELVVLRQRNKLSGELNVVRHPLSKLSGELNNTLIRPHKYSGELNVNTLRSQNKFSGEINTLNRLSPLNDYGMVRWSSSKEGTEKNDSCSESENDDATFSDAVDTFSVNCSVSGVSGSERGQEKRSSENIVSTDAKAREFMMDRFLPAAKAMTLEPSQYASRKQSVGVEQSQPKEVNALVPRPKTPPSCQNVCNIVPYTGQDIGSEESEEEGDDSYDERSALSVKINTCGFLPWFCSKNSLRILNPLPSMKSRSKSALSSASKVTNLVKTGSWKSPSQKLPKDAPHSYQKHEAYRGYKSGELQKPRHTSRPMFYSGELQTRSGSPYSRRSSACPSPSPYRTESPHSVYHKGVGFLAVPKRVDPHDDNIRFSTSSRKLEDPRKSMRQSPTAVEKTLYIDPVNITKVSHSILNVSKTKRQVNPSCNELGVANLETSAQFGGRMEIMKARGMSGPLVCGRVDDAKVVANGKTNSCRELVLVGDDSGNTTMQSPLTPPLPKSPSESWLSRNLRSVSPRNSVSYSSLNSKLMSRKQNVQTHGSGAKWETIVKSSHLRHDHGRYSEELVTRVPQPPRTWK